MQKNESFAKKCIFSIALEPNKYKDYQIKFCGIDSFAAGDISKYKFWYIKYLIIWKLKA